MVKYDPPDQFYMGDKMPIKSAHMSSENSIHAQAFITIGEGVCIYRYVYYSTSGS